MIRTQFWQTMFTVYAQNQIFIQTLRKQNCVQVDNIAFIFVIRYKCVIRYINTMVLPGYH